MTPCERPGGLVYGDAAAVLHGSQRAPPPPRLHQHPSTQSPRPSSALTLPTPLALAPLSSCVFYLVLRALDTVEDDMALDAKIKVPLLRCFHEKSYDR